MILFNLLLILEIVFFGSLEFRPDWPLFVPEDSFVLASGGTAKSIELDFDNYSLHLEYDAVKRLVKFPYFFENRVAEISASYGISGSLLNLSINLISETETDNQIIEIDFPGEFLPFGRFSPGGSFAPIKVVNGSEIFYVYLFETQTFLTETWYSAEGNMLVFAKANINHIEGRWRINGLQIHSNKNNETDDETDIDIDTDTDSISVQFIDYFYDSFGNVTEVRYGDRVYSALYRGNRPIYRNYDNTEFSLHWDTLSILRNVVFLKDNEGIEYSLEYNLDEKGNWINRRNMYYYRLGGLSVPEPSDNGIINRRIIY